MILKYWFPTWSWIELSESIYFYPPSPSFLWFVNCILLKENVTGNSETSEFSLYLPPLIQVLYKDPKST